jgi:VWFA-related protein
MAQHSTSAAPFQSYSADGGTQTERPPAKAPEHEIPQGPVFKSNAREVSVVFRVVDKDNQFVPGITRKEIRIEDDGISRDITSFIADVGHAQVVVLADVSGSMSTVLEPLRGALSTFADLVSKDFDREPGDVLLSLVPFSDTATLLVDRTSKPMAFKEAVNRLRPAGSTALVDTILATLLNAFGSKEISSPRAAVAKSAVDDNGPIPSEFRRKRPSTQTDATKRSKFLVIFTDAGENASAHAWSDIASTMLGKEVVIYSVAFDSGTPDSNVPLLSRVTLESGGKVYRARVNDLERVYAQIAKDIRSHYALTFSANGVENPRVWRNIGVSTTRPGVTIFARNGYCPETPCQKADGTFVGGRPKSWNELLTLSRDPAVVSSVRQRLQELKLEYSSETEKIVRDLANDPLLIEKIWNSADRRSAKTEKPRFVTHKLANGNQLVNIDAEVCGIKLDPETASSRQFNVTTDPSMIHFSKSVFTVVNPEIRLSRRPGSAEQGSSDSAEDSYFQSQAVFYLKDFSGRIPSRIRVQCNRPHFLISEDLVQFSLQALEQD